MRSTLNSLEQMEHLCKYIYAKDSTDRIRTQAILCHIYHHALHDNWYQARDLMLMSHLQESIQHSDVPTQIMYNRALVQLGLCAFRHGNIRDAHNALLDIQSGGRAKEMLAQVRDAAAFAPAWIARKLVGMQGFRDGYQKEGYGQRDRNWGESMVA
ncbi:conserved hypothetical protein [Ixodes scapularis]|uniref:Eukaryotic translation initiation factor 3 subunit C N-terminal domain-containing protein n=1 Tax=Ixodes scapularis TaxID=6945 RepID=B7P162_IXOSC|nr:conserved hypothetical protein [Ixodes scapularis]|eukprot:XP_002400548.1 conserved hypothetical protein [Ixodes scapularis]